MTSERKLEEKQLHTIWQKSDFIDNLKLPNGDDIIILNPGEHNSQNSGPDFKHARIQIGGITYVGDIEIDLDYSDWKKHGHNINNHYNKVILHLTYLNKQNHHYVYTAEGRKVPSLSIKESISGDNLKFDLILAGKSIGKAKYDLKCSMEINQTDLNLRKTYVQNLGTIRFRNKRDRIFRRLKELKFLSSLKINEPVIRYELTEQFDNTQFSYKDFYDRDMWNQLFYEFIFEALGYSKNKNIMMKLAQNVSLEFLKQFNKYEDRNRLFEAVYFNISGLMPESSSEKDSTYMLSLVNIWNEISAKYDGKRFNDVQWQFLGQRPQNFPTIRIAGGCRIVDAIITQNLLGSTIKKFIEIKSIQVLINSVRSLFIVKASSYWREHFVFNKESNTKLNYLVGIGRADEIFINIILPFLSVYFEIFGEDELVKKVLRVYYSYEQKIDNKIVRNVSQELQLTDYAKKTIYAQGMLELYRKYCTRNKCRECEIGKIIFM